MGDLGPVESIYKAEIDDCKSRLGGVGILVFEGYKAYLLSYFYILCYIGIE